MIEHSISTLTYKIGILCVTFVFSVVQLEKEKRGAEMKITSLKSTLSELDEQLRQTSSKFVSCRDTTLEKEAEANKMRLIAEQAERSVEDCQRQLARKNDDLRENDEKIRTSEQKIGI